MNDSRSKFRTKFLVTPTRKTDRAIILKLLSVIHSPLKVDHFELLTDGSYIVRFMIDDRTRCRIYITHYILYILYIYNIYILYIYICIYI